MSFDTIPEAEQAARLAALAGRALAAWNLGGARISLIKYRENAVFGVTTPAGARHVLRVHRPRYRSDDEIRSEAAWMKALAAAGVETPALLATREGDVLCTASADGVPEPRQCDLLAFLDGAPVGTLEHGVEMDDALLRRTYTTVGEIAARIHEHGIGWQRPSAFTRPAWDADALVGETPVFGRFWELPELAPETRTLLLAARDRARDRLRALGSAQELIHGDLIPDNLLADGRALRVIDFDDCGWSWFGFEVATSLFTLRLSGGFEVALDAFLAGYRSVRAFPDWQLELMPTFLMARGLSYLGWPIGRPEIASQRPLVPFFAAVLSTMATEYLDTTQ